MKIRTSKRKTVGKRRPGYKKAMLPALVAVGGGLATLPASALELGNIVVHSKIGQPLRASVAYALSPNESLESYCVSVRHTGVGSDMPGISSPRTRVADGKISITSRSPIMEPIVTASLEVKCPYTPQVVREYTVFLNPEGAVPEVMETATAERIAAPTPTSAPVARTRPAPVATTPIDPSSQYLVEVGDSLSAIAMRLEGRETNLQATMNAIFLANPDAFIDSDPNLIKAGTLLAIPSSAAVADAAPAELTSTDPRQAPPGTADTVSADTTAANEASGVYSGAESLAAGLVEERQPVYEYDYGAEDEATESGTTTAAGSEAPGLNAVTADSSAGAYSELLPGDPVVDQSLAVDTVTEEPGVRETVEPATAGETPQPRQIIRSPEPTEASNWNWLIWVAAGAISLFAGALVIGPRIREHFGSKPVGGPESGTRPISEHAAPSSPTMAAPEPTMAVEEISPANDDVDFDLSDDSPTEENLTLDADLIAGTGLAQGDDVQVNQDFGFAATAELDLELTEQAAEEDSPETDIIPPPERLPEDLIVEESEQAEDTEYDMSVIVDATKMPDPRDVTERDLKAVPLDDTGQTPIADDYTIDQGVDVDLGALGQDYEDDFAATQALNEEIEQAAAELAADHLDEVIEPSGQTSVELQLANLDDIDLTATLEAQNDDLEDTAKMETEDETVEMPKKGEGGS